MNRSTIAKSLAGIAVFGAFAGAAASAQAQPAYGNGYYYDPCRRDQVQRSTTGGVLGAIIGGVLGGSVASSPAKAEGAGIGAVLGAAVGSNIGKEGAACNPTLPREPAYSRSYYYNATPGYGGYYDAPQAYYPPPPPPRVYVVPPAPRYPRYGYGYETYRGGYDRGSRYSYSYSYHYR